jgi:hypothetical protein
MLHVHCLNTEDEKKLLESYAIRFCKQLPMLLMSVYATYFNSPQVLYIL